jgi:hypothetical protein
MRMPLTSPVIFPPILKVYKLALFDNTSIALFICASEINFTSFYLLLNFSSCLFTQHSEHRFERITRYNLGLTSVGNSANNS